MSDSADSAARAIAEFDNVSLRRDGRALFSGIALSISTRSIHAVVGQNGSGKSSLVAMLLGQLSFEGSIRLHFQNSGKIGFVPQQFSTDRTMPITVREFMALGRTQRPICFGVGERTRTQIDSALALLNATHLSPKRLGELSGGELRKVLIANAISPAPELLVCDEPNAGLDAASVEELDKTLTTLRDEQGTTVVLISHDPQQVRRIADAVTLVRDGAVVTGSVAELMPLAFPEFVL